MIKRFILLMIVTILGATQITNAQDPEFTQFYANKLYLNPAFAGSQRCPRISVNYRNQWPALGSTYVTYNASYDQFVRPLEGGLGILLMNDVQGDGAISTSTISGMYSYALRANRFFTVRMGFQASYYQKKLNWDFVFPDMLHPLYGPIWPTNEIPPSNLSRSFFDFSAGIVGFNRDYFFGVAVHHLTEPLESFYSNSYSESILPRKYTVHFGTKIPLPSRRFKRGELSLSPQFIFQQQQDFQQVNYGLYLNRTNIVAGIWVRQNFGFHYDSFIMLVGFVQDKIQFAYSYDLTISKLKNQTLGAHEVSYQMEFYCKPQGRKFRTISCPSF
jgi:type IX secretion system PorP/SprF family membrane protein